MNAPYFIGQTLPPAEERRGIVWGPEIPPTWYALVVKPQKERAVRDFLRAKDIYAFFPSYERERSQFGKRYKIEAPLVTQHVYAQFRQAPQWDVMTRTRRLITGTFTAHGVPIAIHRDIIRHLQGLTVEAEALRRAREEMLRVREGDKAVFRDGPTKEWEVDVLTVKDGQVWFEYVTSGLRGKTTLAALERRA